MNKKISLRVLSLILLILSVLAIMTGCVRYGVGIVIHPDDSGDVELSFGVDREYYQSFAEQYGNELYEGKETFEIKDGDTVYVCVSEHKKFKNLEELKKILLDLKYTNDDTGSLLSDGINDMDQDCEENDTEVISESEYQITPAVAIDDESQKTDSHIFKNAEIQKKDGFFNTTYRVSLVTNAFPASSEELNMLGINTDDFFNIQVSVTLPGKVQAEGADVHNNTASFKMTDLEKENTLLAVSRSVDTVRIISLIAAVVILILLIALFAKGGKKKPDTETLKPGGND